MGTWSYQPFGNDVALDWVEDLIERKNLSLIQETLDNAIDEGADYLDAEIAEESLAAIEVLAKIKGKPTQTDAYTEEVDLWVSENFSKLKITTALSKKVIKVLKLVQSENSELMSMWKEAGTEDFEKWNNNLNELSNIFKI